VGITSPEGEHNQVLFAYYTGLFIGVMLNLLRDLVVEVGESEMLKQVQHDGNEFLTSLRL